ncbi:MAG: VWA domain-containing protein, partial [Desulfamplus sp.]|nr:VWA domain-containing protein [Desulfamplus sp.]
MKFSNPHMFYLIWLVIMLFGFVVYGNRKRAKIVINFISPSLLNTMIPGYSTSRKWLKGILLTLSLFFLALALTCPLVGFRWEEVKEKGVDIMIALDCSRSMLATDIKPTRLEQAKREIVDLLNMMHSDRVGLVAFAGTSILQCPLTLDHSGFSIFLNALNPDYLPMGGTDISGALETAINGFETKSDSEKAIIIITDGESTSGDPVAIATEAGKKGIRIFCIGVGQDDGAPIPDTDGSFKKDDSGRIIMSKVDDEILRKIAAVGNGIYVKSVAGDMDLDQIYTDEIQKNMKKTTLHSGRTKVWENRFQWFLLPAVLLLIAELMISEQIKMTSIQKKFKLGIFIGILTVFFMTCNLVSYKFAYAGSSASVKKGLEAYEKGKYDDALKNFIDAQLERP